ncbi:MAG TPA: hypothetical protein DCF65_11900 [Chloroflexi bacterium]|nr:hypothetical protein [Chloroflexota bacterium]HAF19905.1 hypothetical protein [Chloroflexota bacterium]
MGEVRKALLYPRILRRYGITQDEFDEFCRRIEQFIGGAIFGGLGGVLSGRQSCSPAPALQARRSAGAAVELFPRQRPRLAELVSISSDPALSTLFGSRPNAFDRRRGSDGSRAARLA